jgi:V8-like Glu-specific endopeptidase
VFLTFLAVFYVAMRGFTLMAADSQNVSAVPDLIREISHIATQVEKERKVQEQEKRCEPVEDQSSLATVPLPSSNGPVEKCSALKVLREEGSPRSIRNTIARQTPEERIRIAEDINNQILQLQALLNVNERDAVRTYRPDVAKGIAAVNEALSAKRQAYAFAQGTTTAISPAAAKTYAAVSNPFFLMCGSRYWAPKDPIPWWDKISRVGDRLATHGRSVGLISVGDRIAGSGVVVGPSHILTNQHVMEEFAYKDSKGFWTIQKGKDVTVTFDKECSLGDICPSPNIPRGYYVKGVYFVAKNRDDLAILLTSSDENFPQPIHFGERKPSDYAGNMDVALIGYPGAPGDMTSPELLEFFRSPITKDPQFGFKRLSEGRTDAKAVTPDGLFVHLANTAPGNSGSPVFDLKDATPVGLHVKGMDHYGNYLGYNFALTSERVNMLLTDSGLAQR